MPINALVMDSKAIELMSQATIDANWFQDFVLPDNQHSLRRREAHETAYILSEEAGESSKLLIVNATQSGIGRIDNPERVFSRILRMALTTWGHFTGIPRSFKPFRRDNFLSIFAYQYNWSDSSRLYFRFEGDNRARTFVYSMSKDKNRDFEQIEVPNNIYDEALSGFSSILRSLDEDTSNSPSKDPGYYGIVFDEFIGKTYGGVAGATIEDWCGSKLTRQQLDFVNAPLDSPIRLRGAAGTGKTQCMTIKCLKELFQAQDDGRPLRIGFITHSSGVAHDVVEGMICALDPDNRRRTLDEQQALWVGSLYELANEKLEYDKKGIVPLSLDGAGGRTEQEEWLEEFVKECRGEEYFLALLQECSKHVRKGLTEDPMSDRFRRELANEVACSLDSERVRKSDKVKSDEYIHGSRREWQMSLPNEADRRALLEVHDKYAGELAKSDYINIDQMIADFLDFLQSYQWSNYRKAAEGFDIVFVDELHCFNGSERMVFHSLVRGDSMQNSPVPLFMAYDLKQSTDDRFLGVGAAGRFFKTLAAGKSKLVELTQVFRSTVEITEFLAHLDGSFPALDLEKEWRTYNGHGSQNGAVPQLRTYPTDLSLLDDIVKQAYRHANQENESGRNVAVLCMSDSLFGKYAKAGRIADMVSVVESNTDLTELRYARNRCVFSMPDNVAGLQFERVYLIYVDKQELDSEDLSLGAQRQLLSRLYLGASRASRDLTLAVSHERGGVPDILRTAIDHGVLAEVDGGPRRRRGRRDRG